MTLKALIFDVDGTLAETEEVHRESFNQAFAAFQLDWHWDKALYHQLLGVTGGKERIKHFTMDYPELAKCQLSDESIKALHEHKTHLYCQKIESGEVGLRPGIARLLCESHKAGLKLAIGTTTSRPNVDRLLKATLGEEGAQWFSVLATGDQVPHKKPAPDIFELALSKLGLAAQDCLAFEDSRQGFLSASRAHLPVIITVSEYSRTHDFSEPQLPPPVAIVSDLGEPETPFQPLGGQVEEPAVVDLDLLKEWHQKSSQHSHVN